jgi:hypothetical protein
MTRVMNDPEVPPTPAEQGVPPDGDPALPSENAKHKELLPVGTQLVDPIGRIYTVDSNSADMFRAVPKVDPDKEPDPDEDPVLPVAQDFVGWHNDLVGSDSQWSIHKPTVDQLLWTEPALQFYIDEHSDQEAAIKDNIRVFTDPSITDPERLKNAGDALDLPGVTVLGLLKKAGFEEETIAAVKEVYNGNEGKEQLSPEEQEASDIVDDFSNDVNTLTESLPEGGYNALSPDGKVEFVNKVAALRKRFNEFKETDLYQKGVKRSIKILILFLALAALFQIAMITAHAGGLGGKR